MIMRTYPRLRRGLGQTCMGYPDFVAALPAPRNCSPLDSQCVSCNQQREDVIANLQAGPCVTPGTAIAFQCDTSPAAFNAFMSNVPVVPATTIQAPGAKQPVAVSFQGTAPIAGSTSTATPNPGSSATVPQGTSAPADSLGISNWLLWIGAGLLGFMLIRAYGH